MKINKLYRLFTTVCFTLFYSIAIAQNGTDVTATVVDEQGNPISGVDVFNAKGEKASSDVNGQFKIKLLDDESVVLEKKGYESAIINMFDLTDTITMETSPFLASEDDEIKMGVATKYRRDIVGAVSSINTEDRLTYDNTQFVRNYINGLMLGVRGSENIRGIGNAIFVIDGVIGRDPNILNMEEVDQITVLKDANSVALYGSQGKNGVIVINTKRGKANKKEVNVNILSGYSAPISLPNYLSSAAYMTLFNEASLNDGVQATNLPFSTELIANTRSGINKFKYPDLDLYSPEFVQPFVGFTNVITEFSGGNDKNQYYVNLGWNRTEEWVNINDDINAGTNRFNVRGNIDFKINDWISSSLDGIAVISTNKSSRADILDVATTLKPNEFSPFLPVDLIDTSDPIVAGQLLAARRFNGMILGTSLQQGLRFLGNTDGDNNSFNPLSAQRSPIALAIAGGYEDTVFRSIQFNNTINFDLDRITKGLSAKTYISFDFYDSYNLTIRNQFKTYVPAWEGNRITNFGIDNTDPLNPIADNSRIFGEDVKDQTENLTPNGFLSRFGFYGLINYDTTFAKDHSLNTTLLGYYNSQRQNDVIQTDVDAHLGFQMAYDYKKKLFIDFTGTYTNSIKLPEGNRGGFSPTSGIAYIISEEPFLKNSNFINYLKLKASGGIILSDQGIVALNDNGTVDNDASNYYLYDVNYSDGNNFNWADGNGVNRRQNITQGENLDLTFEERIDLNLGFETYLMNSLWIEANYFRTELDKQITFLQDQYPSYYNIFRPYNNFNKDLYTGFELGLNFNKTYQDFSISLGANLLHSQTERAIRSEIFNEDYLQSQGREISTIFGLVDQGFYAESDFSGIDSNGNYILNTGSAVPDFGTPVQPGDIKYKDQNGDNIIDNDDRIGIGQSSSPWTFGVNLNLKYKRFNFFVLATGQTGAVGNKLSSSFNEYYSVDGNDKYSEVVLGRWTPETASTATFPRLSSQTNQNNFRTSTFWLYDTSSFNINRAQITYEFQDSWCNQVGIEDLSINLSGTNLLEIGENRDIRQLRIGTAPLSRAYTFGLRMSF